MTGAKLAQDARPVKRTVVLHPIMDKYVRRTWASLIEHGFDATYSMALNCIVLGAIMEAIGERGWSEETGGLSGGSLRTRRPLIV